VCVSLRGAEFWGLNFREAVDSIVLLCCVRSRIALQTLDALLPPAHVFNVSPMHRLHVRDGSIVIVVPFKAGTPVGDAAMVRSVVRWVRFRVLVFCIAFGHCQHSVRNHDFTIVCFAIVLC
jgi:hypothetical protein